MATEEICSLVLANKDGKKKKKKKEIFLPIRFSGNQNCLLIGTMGR